MARAIKAQQARLAIPGFILTTFMIHLHPLSDSPFLLARLNTAPLSSDQQSPVSSRHWQLSFLVRPSSITLFQLSSPFHIHLCLLSYLRGVIADGFSLNYGSARHVYIQLAISPSPRLMLSCDFAIWRMYHRSLVFMYDKHPPFPPRLVSDPSFLIYCSLRVGTVPPLLPSVYSNTPGSWLTFPARPEFILTVVGH